MIRSLRRAHFTSWLILGFAMALLFVAALVVRKPAPVNPRHPDFLSGKRAERK
jgi:hypothetical protein